ncbi:flagellar motor switch phosphatase FliY [Sporolactobacillus inulinus]|uniref:Flagellar motor switch protein FliN n=1 Tax=Sporolactobacillus inulinus TaxID=2078 RepID=A0A4Y3T4D5_9BACL|nr:flagellar motor switch phosphatase FliY [Sporolactobacillus inulinus]GAY74550.1 flagellar motor switch protein FliN [Sporolactobacillus inulinus]GEB75907.1 flagellar motor switch phosphatase FliY [Sporolactobacillus inulinus]
MSDGKLSQEEIDALLGNHEDAAASSEQETQKTDQGNHGPEGNFSDLDKDVLGEIGNISFGSAATALSTILNRKVEITTPQVRLVNRGNLSQEFPVPHVSVLVNYTEGFQGSCLLIIKVHDASVIANLMMGGDGTQPSDQISDMEMSAVQEAMNQMMGSSSTAMSTVFNRRIDISPPKLNLMDVKSKKGIEHLPLDEEMFEIAFQLKIGDLVDSQIMQLVPINFGKQLVQLLVQESSGKAANDSQADQTEAAAARDGSNERETAAAVAEPELTFSEKEQEHNAQTDVSPVAFSDFDEEEQPHTEPTPRNMNLLMDIPLDVTVELGHTKKTIKDVLELGPGSIIELDKLAGEAIDILVNQKYIAKGEVVVVDENFGIRITEILNQSDRISQL